ncbi:MAG: hypothetical protein LBN37_00170 [Bacteroidales bacterium]|jgi:hypothetical protein|nr:hypothetical protein [Bacteroidales bacterium]
MKTAKQLGNESVHGFQTWEINNAADYEAAILLAHCEYGLTKREHFAGLAMQAMVGDLYCGEETVMDVATQIGRSAVIFADALLKALTRED